MSATINLRDLSQIFTTINFNRVVRSSDYKATKKKIRNFYSREEFPNIDYKTAINHVYSHLELNYRCEYFYKNNLFNKCFLEKYKLSTTSIYSEFKIGSSIADFVLINGCIKVFEIKTDLDNIEKLKGQISNYQKFADFVYIVVSPKLSKKLLEDYSASNVGIIEFTNDNSFEELKEASRNPALFDHQTLFKSLRKLEYIEIINDYYGFVPDVPNTKIFRICFELALEIEVEIFQKLVLNKLKKRKIKCHEYLESDSTPYSLKHIAYLLDFNEDEYLNLYKFLNKRL